ncbi:MAG: exo-alpha-sialidase [Fuerstiella sp.]
MTQSVLALEKVRRFCDALIDQQKARAIVMPQESKSGFWFGGGNMILDADGHLLVVGRYRNAGDSRTGISSGTRGLELAIFRSVQPSTACEDVTFEKVLSFSKPELQCGDQEVLSIEGSCLRRTESGFQLFVSTEKANVSYPARVSSFQKPGAGVWTIDVLKAVDLAGLKQATVQACLQSEQPEHLHVKDPFFWNDGQRDRLGFCSHPFNWSSSNSGVVKLNDDGSIMGEADFNVVDRGTTWDVAMTRTTSVLPMPAVASGLSEWQSILFYCGGECVRELGQHATAVSRPRGYSCEEIGGTLLISDSDARGVVRISDLLPQFVSPYGTGCSRYVDVCQTPEGYFATWQQSQTDFSQPLVMNFVAHELVIQIFEAS